MAYFFKITFTKDSKIKAFQQKTHPCNLQFITNMHQNVKQWNEGT